MILMVEKGIRGRICHAICRYTKSNNKYMKHWHVNTLCGWARSQMLPANDFTGIEETSQFNEGFIKKYNDDSDNGYFLEVDVQHPENLHNLHNDLFTLFDWKHDNLKSYSKLTC